MKKSMFMVIGNLLAATLSSRAAEAIRLGIGNAGNTSEQYAACKHRQKEKPNHWLCIPTLYLTEEAIGLKKKL